MFVINLPRNLFMFSCFIVYDYLNKQIFIFYFEILILKLTILKKIIFRILCLKNENGIIKISFLCLVATAILLYNIINLKLYNIEI